MNLEIFARVGTVRRRRPERGNPDFRHESFDKDAVGTARAENRGESNRLFPPVNREIPLRRKSDTVSEHVSGNGGHLPCISMIDSAQYRSRRPEDRVIDRGGR